MTNYISTPLSTLNADLNAIQTTLSSKADKSELANYAQLSDIPEVPEGDYLPLSGGNLSGRIYLKTTETRIVGSTCVFTFSATENPYLSFEDQTEEVNIFVSLSVENAGQEFIDMITDEEWTGEGTDYTVKAYVEANEELYGTTKSTTVTGTVNFGNSHADGSITIDLDFPEYAEDESNLIINEIVFADDAGNSPTVHINYTADWVDYSTAEEYLNAESFWTVETISEEVEVNEPFVLSSEIPEVSAFATKTEVSAKADLTALTALALDVEDNYCTNQYASQTFATKNELTAYATKTYVQEYVAEHGGGGGGDFLPLSGGNLSGRIYLKTTTGEQTIDTSMVVGYYSDENCNAEISVYTTEEIIRNGGGSAGASANCSAKIYDKTNDISNDVSMVLSPGWSENPDTEEEEYDGTWFGNYDTGDGIWSINVNAVPEAEVTINADITWENSEGTAFVNAFVEPLSNPTSDTTVETITPFVTSADVDTVIGDINSILDSINGQTI